MVRAPRHPQAPQRSVLGRRHRVAVRSSKPSPRVVSGPYDVRLTQGHVLRHAPAQSPQGRDAAVIDIARICCCVTCPSVGPSRWWRSRAAPLSARSMPAPAGGSRPTSTSPSPPSTTTLPPSSDCSSMRSTALALARSPTASMTVAAGTRSSTRASSARPGRSAPVEDRRRTAPVACAYRAFLGRRAHP